MKIVADENIPYVKDAFGPLGDVVMCSGRAMTPAVVKDASILLVRSITKVNRALLEGSAVRFVATATIGEDHIDRAYLAERAIGFSSAPGSNANSVAEYISAALLLLAQRYGLALDRMTLGIVGVGNVGKRAFAKARALGLHCVLNDPPVARETGDVQYRPLSEVLRCDIVTFHVPLTESGPDATHHLADAQFLQALKPGAIVLNTSRGPVIDNTALKQALKDGHLRACVLDVWEGEPSVDVELLERTFIATPHIAGYSFDGKVNGTRQIYEGVCQFLGTTPTWDPAPLLPVPECGELVVRGDSEDSTGAIREAVLAVYDIRRDDAAMRRLLAVAPSERPRLFDQLRKEYPRRREFFNTRVTVRPQEPHREACLEGLGFRLRAQSASARPAHGPVC